MNCQSTQDLLNGYVDGELDLVNHIEIEKHLQSCEQCRSLFENVSVLKSALSDDSLRFATPAGLRSRIRSASRAVDTEKVESSWRWRWFPAIALSAALVVIVVLLFNRPASTTDDLLTNEIVSSHVRSMMANHLTDVPSSDQHTVKPWFDGKLDYSPPVVDLTGQGFQLIGGRLDYAASRPVAALVYQRHQHFINLFIFPSAGGPDSGDRLAVRQGYNLVHWTKSGMNFWAVSDLNLSELQEFAQDLQN